MADRAEGLWDSLDAGEKSFFGGDGTPCGGMDAHDETRNFSREFSFRQVGSISKYVEPVSVFQPINHVLDIFDRNPDIQAIPVEECDVVVGYIDRASMEAAARGFLGRLMLKSTAAYVKRVPIIIYAKEYCEMCLTKVFAAVKESGASYFPVFYYRKSFYGLISVDDLVARIAEVREQDLGWAREIQQGIMPSGERLNSLPFAVSAWNRMANPIGGDLYSIYKISQAKYIAACFDVSGKNVAAALVTVALSSFFAGLKFFSQSAPTPQEIIAALDRFIEDTVPLGTFVTAGIFHVDLEEKRLSVFNCGHTVIYFFAPGGASGGKRTIKMSEVQAFLPPLGIGAVAEALEGGGMKIPSCAIERGLKAELYTDGLEDMQTEEGMRFGSKRVKSLFKSLYLAGKSGIARKIEAAVDEWTNKTMLHDDITVVDVSF